MTSAASRRLRSSGSSRGRAAIVAAASALAIAAAGAAAAAPRAVGAFGMPPGDLAAGADAGAQSLRAARRASVRAATATALATGKPARLTLLVVPVDFADQRLPADWEPGPAIGWRLQPPAAASPATPPVPPIDRSLATYFRNASCGRAELDVVLAPLVRLPGVTADYSDRGRAGFTRTRRLAAEAMAGARRAGVLFSRLDNDGPDGFPGTADDDGEVDGVLVLHDDAGDENDPDAGRIQALQYYLEEPVADQGTLARLYAVASLHSRLGVWAHETAHLFGLEDRYDPFLPVTGGDVAGRGGLGIFSLMAAGAFGAGAAEPGDSPALPDAYSAAQLGWRDIVTKRGLPGAEASTLRPPPLGAEVWRVWTRGESGPEFFLLETRARGLDFDGDLPEGQLLVLHVDEEVAERAQSSPDPDARHLRVRLVEADGDGSLAAGEDAGGPSDVFPGSGGHDAFTPTTAPPSDGYGGPTEVALTEIVPADSGAVSVRVADASTPAFRLDFAFEAPAATGEPWRLRLRAVETGIPAQSVTASVRVASAPAWGSFGGADSVRVPLAFTAADTSWAAAEAPAWTPSPPPAGEPAATSFRIRLETGLGVTQSQERAWAWTTAADPLAFADAWPGEWTTDDRSPQAGTAWHRWRGEPSLRADGGPVLACTGADYASPAGWPGVSYGNGADVALVSGVLPDSVAAVRIVHAVDGELLRPSVAYDGGLVEFLLPDGSLAAAAPVDGYDGVLAPEALHALHGRPAFAAEDSATTAGPWRWRVDVVPVPHAQAGPVRLRLRFASDEIYRGRGWFVASLTGLTGASPPSAFPVASVRAGGEEWLVWSWPWEAASSFELETSADNGATWRSAWTGWPGAGPGGWAYGVPAAVAGEGVAGARQRLRVVAHLPLGAIASRPIASATPRDAVAPPRLAAPFPNPARGDVHLALEDCREGDRLVAFDLRGRRLREWTLAAGAQVIDWDGRDDRGRRLAAGVYVLRLTPRRSYDPPATRSLVWWP